MKNIAYELPKAFCCGALSIICIFGMGGSPQDSFPVFCFATLGLASVFDLIVDIVVKG